MKTWIITLFITLTTIAATQASELSVTLENGTAISVTEDTCLDPATGAVGLCLIAVTDSNSGQDACYNPATGMLEPCLSAALAGDQAPACYDPVTKRWEPCW